MRTFIEESDIEPVNVLFVSDDSDLLEKMELKLSDSKRLNGFFSDNRESTERILESDEVIECAVIGSEMFRKDGSSLLDYISENYETITTIIMVDSESEEMIEKAVSKEADNHMLKYEGRKCVELLENRVINAVKNRKKAETTTTILERITDGFLAFDEDDKLYYINNEVCRMLKKDKDDLLGAYIWEAFPAAMGTKFQKYYKEAMKTQRPVYFEEYYPPVDGWFSAKGYPSESGMTVYLQDITERRRREERLEGRVKQQNITNDLLRMALEEKDTVEIQHKAVEDITKTLDTDFARLLKFDENKQKFDLAAQYNMSTSQVSERSIEMDEGYQESFTYDSKESIVINDYNKEREFQRTKLMGFLGVKSGLSVLVGGYSNPWGVLSTYNRSTKSYSPDEIRFVEGVANVLATSIEYQEKHRELREYKMAIDSVNYGISMVDSDQRIIMANKAFQKLSGYRNEQLVGKKFNFLAEYLQENKESNEAVIQRSNGEEVNVDIHLSPITLPEGTKGHVAVIKRKESIDRPR